MEDIFLYSSFSVLLLLLAFKYWLKTRTQHKNLPPSPPAIPIIGHLHLLKQPLHRTFYKLSQKYGPIISLRFGSHLVIVVSSPSAVEECFTKNDIVFANRPSFILDKYLGYNHTTLVTAPYGDHWRNLRRISAIEIFSSNHLNVFLGTRRDEVKILLRKLYRASSHDFAKVELKPMFSELTFNTIMRMVAGKRYYGEDVTGIEEARQFREMITEVFEYAGVSYLGDYLPTLQWVDYRGFLKKVKKLSARVDLLLQGLINEHRIDKRCTMISHLLSLQESQPEYYTDEIIKGLILVSEISVFP